MSEKSQTTYRPDQDQALIEAAFSDDTFRWLGHCLDEVNSRIRAITEVNRVEPADLVAQRDDLQQEVTERKDLILATWRQAECNEDLMHKLLLVHDLREELHAATARGEDVHELRDALAAAKDDAARYQFGSATAGQ